MIIGLIAGLIGGIAVLLFALLKKPMKCPKCGFVLPKFRKPQSSKQAMWGGCTCLNCGAEVDRSGNLIGEGAGVPKPVSQLGQTPKKTCPKCAEKIQLDALVCIHCGQEFTEAGIQAAKKYISEEDIDSKVKAGAEKLKATSRLFLTSGIINIIAGIIATAFGWFLGILSILLGIWELVNAGRYWTLPPKTTRNPVYMGVLEIINIVCGPLWSLFFGISNLNRLKSPETKAYFAMLEKGGGPGKG